MRHCPAYHCVGAAYCGHAGADRLEDHLPSHSLNAELLGSLHGQGQQSAYILVRFRIEFGPEFLLELGLLAVDDTVLGDAGGHCQCAIVVGLLGWDRAQRALVA